MNEALVSIIITTYKRPIEILKRALESAINQTYRYTEIIVVNDYPEDNEEAKAIKKLVDAYSSKIFYYSPQSNSGACAARNLGLSKASGEYVAFLDDDDEWFKDKIKVQLSGFRNENIGLTYTPFYRNDGDKKKLSCNELANEKILELLLYKHTMALFPLIRMKRIKEIGGFDSNLKSSQDHDLILRLARICKFAYIDTPTANYNVSEESISTNVTNKIDGFNYFMKKHEILYKEYPDAYHYQMIKMCNNILTAGKYYDAKKYWSKAIEVKPFSLRNITEPLKGITKKILRKQPFH